MIYNNIINNIRRESLMNLPVALEDRRFIGGHDMLMMSLMHMNLSFVSPQASTA